MKSNFLVSSKSRLEKMQRDEKYDADWRSVMQIVKNLERMTHHFDDFKKLFKNSKLKSGINLEYL